MCESKYPCSRRIQKKMFPAKCKKNEQQAGSHSSLLGREQHHNRKYSETANHYCVSRDISDDIINLRFDIQ